MFSESFDQKQSNTINQKNIKVGGFSNKSLHFKNKFGESA